MLQNVNQCEHYVVNEFTYNVISLEAFKQLAVSVPPTASISHIEFSNMMNRVCQRHSTSKEQKCYNIQYSTF